MQQNKAVGCSRLLIPEKWEFSENLCLRTFSYIFIAWGRGEGIWTCISHFTSWHQNSIWIYSQCVDNGIVTREVLNEVSIWEFPLLDIIWRTRCKSVTERKYTQYIKAKISVRINNTLCSNYSWMLVARLFNTAFLTFVLCIKLSSFMKLWMKAWIISVYCFPLFS